MSDVEFSSCLRDKPAPLPHFWEHTVGSGHATLALRSDWQRQLKQCHEELGFNHVRFHGWLDDDMGTFVDEEDRLVCSYFNADQICDFLLSIGMRPFVELSFMPSMISSGNDTVFHYAANVTPPKDYDRWADLISRLVYHWIQRYGVEEVREWYFEVWNEPNENSFWKASQEDYFKLYATTADAIKKIDDKVRVGGPATADNAWLPEFLDYCEQRNAPVDFVSTHHYPTDAVGTPGLDTEAELAKSSRSILRDWAQKSKKEARGKPLYYTEWSSTSSPRDHFHDESFTAAMIVKTMMEARGLTHGYSYWTFSDIFEENYMPDKAFHGGFGLLNLQGIAKPSYRAFELLHRLGSHILPVEGSDPTVDVWTITGDGVVHVLVTNFALPMHPIDTKCVGIRLDGIEEPKSVSVERIDEEHANAKRVWAEMGEPPNPSPAQVAKLAAASELQREEVEWDFKDGSLAIELSMPPQSVACITIQN